MHIARGDGNTGNTSIINNLIIVLAVLVGLGLVLLGTLMVLKRIRGQRQQAASPPCYNDVVHENKNLHHLTIETKESRSSVIIYNKDGRPMLANPNSPPHSPDNVPEIHITFPDEEDHSSGRRKSGRVVVVRVGDNAAVGLEPLDEDQLPAYEKAGSFYSIDMDDIGGLKEKSREDYH
ncbi:hypothetical protein BD289DRAFT_279511 [Coniella lustricola]|uniref:Uncharacterized protein n=1 Tax=Coniella lustricola TaxID=2025994 RepID=A0A2T3A6A1_9PEZI|nr:hypothetical protein BD289DRAFT_279511 [Coniella lustricola]